MSSTAAHGRASPPTSWSPAARDELDKAISAIDRRAELLGLVEAYRSLKRQLGLMDFSDQIELAARLADQRPEVGEAERGKFRVVLLDEYQDTSVAQALMLSRIFGGGHPVMAVGDPNQAIYGWRGASVSNILNFGDDFPRADGSPEIARFTLLTSRRSDEHIVVVANRIAAPLYAAMATRPGTGVERLRPQPGAAPGRVDVAVHETYDDELAALADEVKAAHDGVAGGEWSRIGVLTRDNAHAGDVFHALSAAEIPVEIVGLKGLLSLPEVAEVVATLDLLHDLTANDSLLTLLTGPRWAIGPRDLALLGRRAGELADRAGRDAERPLAEELAAAVEGADLTEIPSLCDALEEPGDSPYSSEARERFGLLTDELRALRRHAGEPLLDLVRRIIDTTGIDIELASSVSPAAQARRDNLDLFVKAVAEFQAVDGDATLPALLAYLTAEDDFGNGLDVATPSEADSVKLLTVHRAKGLEWAAVFLVGACESKFPNTRGRSRWVTSPAVLPSPLRGDAHDLPQLGELTHEGLKHYALAAKAHDESEELRLAYVAFTRAEHHLSVSSYLWAGSRKTPMGPSPYQLILRQAVESWGGEVTSWRDKPDKGATNPLTETPESAFWPGEQHTPELLRRAVAADLVRSEIAAIEAGEAPPEPELDLTEAAVVAEWDGELERLLEEARRGRAEEVAVPLPSSLSATTLATLRDDPAGLAESLARPMPRQPSPSARFGTRFHAWVESHFQAQRQELLIDPEDLPGRGDLGIADDSELGELIDSFLAGPFAERGGVTVEPPFALVLAGQVVRGRIDAVFTETLPSGETGYLVVDWKTNRTHSADPLQLAIYRVAWSELTGVPVERIRAGFYYVRDGELVEPSGLPGRDELEEVLLGGLSPADDRAAPASP